MRIRLAHDQVQKLKLALEGAGTREIGGQLFGEQMAPSDFRVTELTVQKRRGSFATFVVDLLQAAADAVRFFNRTEHRYTPFNYIGEWHSHPNDQPASPTDRATMAKLAAHPNTGNPVLLVLRPTGADHVVIDAHLSVEGQLLPAPLIAVGPIASESH